MNFFLSIFIFRRFFFYIVIASRGTRYRSVFIVIALLWLAIRLLLLMGSFKSRFKNKTTTVYLKPVKVPSYGLLPQVTIEVFQCSLSGCLLAWQISKCYEKLLSFSAFFSLLFKWLSKTAKIIKVEIVPICSSYIWNLMYQLHRNFLLSKFLLRKWFEPNSNICWVKMSIWVTGVLRRTVVGDWHFYNLWGGHLDLNLNMASARRVVETSVTNNNPSHDSSPP